jgi:hypothetical protein
MPSKASAPCLRGRKGTGTYATFVPTPDGITVQLFQPANMRDGHGLVLRGSAHLSGEPLKAIGALFLSGGDRAGAYEVTGEQ